MGTPEVIVVAETPSLGSAVSELLLAGGLEVSMVPDLATAARALRDGPAHLPKVIVSTPANRPSDTARSWSDGPFRSIPLVVVGVRLTDVPSADRIHFVTLPLSPHQLLELVRSLVDHPGPGLARGSPRPPAGLEPPAGPRSGVPMGF